MERSRDRLAGAILAGGRASRYGGTAKGLIRLPDGRTIIERLLAELSAAGIDQVVICADDPDPYEPLGRPVVPDLHPGAGPLAGIEAALAHYAGLAPASPTGTGTSRGAAGRQAGRADGAVILPCDLPAIAAGEIAALAAAFRASAAPAVVAQAGDSLWHPLCAVVVVDEALLGEVAAAIAAGRLAVGDFWRACGARGVPFDEEAPFFNVNTPQDLADWLRRGRREGRHA